MRSLGQQAEEIAAAVLRFLEENSRTGKHQIEDENYKDVLTQVIWEAIHG